MWLSGRVIAIRPVVAYSEAEKWQKQAFQETIWLFRPYERMTAATRNILARSWYAIRARYFKRVRGA
jgi:hypothetical protein